MSLSHLSKPARAPWLALGAGVEQIMLAASLFWALAANRLFLSAALKDRVLSEPGTWGYALALLVMLTALNFLLLSLVCTRHTVKPVLTVLIIGTAFASHYMHSFGIYLDPSMMRNVLRTDVAEARELFSWGLLPHLLLYAALPLALLWRVRIVRRPWLRALLVRLASFAGAAVVLVGTLMLVFQSFSSMMRNHKEMRYLATPANYIWSIGAVLGEQAKGAARPRQSIGLDAERGAELGPRSSGPACWCWWSAKRRAPPTGG